MTNSVKQLHAEFYWLLYNKKVQNNKKCDNSRRILQLEINIDDSLFVLINIYNANNEPDQIKTLHDLGKISDRVGDILNKNIIST